MAIKRNTRPKGYITVEEYANKTMGYNCKPITTSAVYAQISKKRRMDRIGGNFTPKFEFIIVGKNTWIKDENN